MGEKEPMESSWLAIDAFLKLSSKNMVDSCIHPSYFNRFLPEPKPLTRWQRIKNRISTIRDRVGMAWRVLRGEDIER